METMIYIEQKDRNEAAEAARGFTVEDVKQRVYVNALGAELVMKYLAQEGINLSNTCNLHSINKIAGEFDISDIMLSNIHIDVRAVYDKNLIFIPKSHFEYGLVPDIYLVLQMTDDTSHANLLGFFKPAMINKNNQNSEYYFIEKEKLSDISDLKSYIENFNGNTTQVLTEDEAENAHRLGLALIDHDITEQDKKELIRMLLKSADLREDLIEFENFERISYHVATTEVLEDLPRANSGENQNLIRDEFEVFEHNDEFPADNFPLTEDDLVDITDENDETAEIELSQDVEENSKATSPEDSIPEEETDAERLSPDETEETEVEISDSGIDDEVPEIQAETDVQEVPEVTEIQEEQEEQGEQEEQEEQPVEQTSEEPEMFEIPELSEISEVPELSEIDAVDLTIPEISDDAIEPEINDQENSDKIDFEPEQAAETEDEPVAERPHLKELDTLLGNFDFDENTAIKEFRDDVYNNNDSEHETVEDEPAEIEEPADIEDLVKTEEPAAEIDLPQEETVLPESAEPEIADFAELTPELPVDDLPQEDLPVEEPVAEEVTESIEDLVLPDNIPSEDNSVIEEPVSIEDIEPVETVEEENIPAESISFEELDAPAENLNSVIDDDTENTAVSFDELQTPIDETLPPADDETREAAQAELQEQAPAGVTQEQIVQEDATAEFLENLAEKTEQSNAAPSYENSTAITNSDVNRPAGEIPIDINMQIPLKPHVSEVNTDMEKLKILYSTSGESQERTGDSLFGKTLLPEKGKKAIIAATAVIAALALLLIYGSVTKTEKQSDEQSTQNILEKNLPQLDDQPIPETAAVMPQKPMTFPEDIAKTAAQNVNTPQAPLTDTPYLEVEKLAWAVPDYVSYNNDFKKYLQTAGKSLKLSLSSDLLLATEYAYSDQIQVDVVVSKDGVVKDSKILQSSGSTQIDNIVLRTVNDTLKVVKAPAGVIVGDNIHLTLKIYL